MVSPSHVTHDNSDAFLLAVVIQDLQEGPELGAKISLSKTDDHGILYLYIALLHREGEYNPPSMPCLSQH